MIKVDVLHRSITGEPGGLDAQSGPGGFPFADLVGEDRGEVLLRRPACVAGLSAEAAERVGAPWCAQSPGEVLDL